MLEQESAGKSVRDDTCSDPKLIPDNVMDLLLDMVCAVDGDGRLVYVSAASERMLGLRPDEMIGREMMAFVHPDDREATRAVAQQVMQGMPVTSFENRYLHRDGRSVDILWSAGWLSDTGLRLGVAKDVTELKCVQRVQETMLAVSKAVNRSGDAEMLCSQLREAIELLMPVRSVRLSMPHSNGRRIHSVQAARSGDRREPDAEPLRFSLDTEGGENAELIIDTGRIADNGAIADSEVFRFLVEQATSAVRRLQQQERLLRMAHFDALTELPNRVLFNDRLETALNRARREGGQLALLYMDLIGFKTTNDTLGHQAGDELLQLVAQRLNDCLRATDSLGRPGGDEFTALLIDVGGPEETRAVIHKIHEALARGFQVRGHAVEVAVSIGMAHFPCDGNDADTLYAMADQAMYASRALSQQASLPGR